LRRNPFKPDDGAPWCHKCRAHTPCYVYQILQFAGEAVRNEYYCRVCKEQIMRRVGWRVASTFTCMIAICVGFAVMMVYFLSEGASDQQDILFYGLPVIAIACWPAVICGLRLRALRRWKKQYSSKTEEEVDELGKIYSRSVVPYAGEDPEAHDSF